MSEWIRIENELPIPYFDVLLFIGYPINESYIGYRNSDGFVIYNGIANEETWTYPVTHWINLPEPPNE